MKHPLILLAGLAMTMLAAPAWSQEKLERGKDRIDTPAIGSGLCVHNLFQSNMVVQRDKLIPIWSWAAPGETITVSFAGNTTSAKAAQ